MKPESRAEIVTLRGSRSGDFRPFWSPGRKRRSTRLYMPIAWFRGAAEQGFLVIVWFAPSRRQHLNGTPQPPWWSCASALKPSLRPRPRAEGTHPPGAGAAPRRLPALPRPRPRAGALCGRPRSAAFVHDPDADVPASAGRARTEDPRTWGLPFACSSPGGQPSELSGASPVLPDCGTLPVPLTAGLAPHRPGECADGVVDVLTLDAFAV